MPQMRGIREITLAEFKQLCQPREKQSVPPLETADSPALENGSARQETHAADSTSAARKGGLARFFNSDRGERQQCAQPWAISEDDELPTLAEAFKACCLLAPCLGLPSST